jgi:hypothetical protein
VFIFSVRSRCLSFTELEKKHGVLKLGVFFIVAVTIKNDATDGDKTTTLKTVQNKIPWRQNGGFRGRGFRGRGSYLSRALLHRA